MSYNIQNIHKLVLRIFHFCHSLNSHLSIEFPPKNERMSKRRSFGLSQLVGVFSHLGTGCGFLRLAAVD